jgi:FtsP/CotA-like multicopper oxidase with cupredoxin domain
MKPLITSLLLLGSLLLPLPWPGRHAPAPAVIPNDNRVPAGRLQGDTLELALVLGLATWRPQGADGPSVEVPALAEEGKAPQIPAPLIRVPAGTVVRATVRNALDSAYTIQGLFTRDGKRGGQLAVPGRSSRTVTFAAGAPGTYFYGAFPAGYVPPIGPDDRGAEREQASGALVIDPPGGSPPDRILVMNIWGDYADSVTYRNALTINGLSWPATERIGTVTGDTVRWRVVNASARGHPMHLHGFYFTMVAKGDAAADHQFSPAERRLAVTDQMAPYSTLTLSWIAERPGNWLFHCHLAFHVVPATRLDPPGHDSHDARSHDAGKHMAGLVLGMQVSPGPGYLDADRGTPERRHLFAQEGSRRGRAPRSLGYVLQQDGRLPAADSIEIPGTVLVFEQGKPVDMVVTNRLAETVAVHWHGLELESWSDGVAGWSGTGTAVAPAIAPGDSFTAHLTVPRAGTFIYHTHMNDIEQITSGLYGAIVVVEPGDRFDPATDHVLVIGWDGDGGDGPPPIVVNGDSLPPPLELASGLPHRLRFVNIGPAAVQQLELRRDTVPAPWRRLALDGADLPPDQATVVPARHRIAVGQTADFELRLEPGEYLLTYSVAPALPPVRQRVLVR